MTEKIWLGTVTENFRLQCSIEPLPEQAKIGAPKGLGFMRSSLSDSMALEDNKPVVGDIVEYTETPERHLVISRILPRRNSFARKEAGARFHKNQVIAANIDGLLLCQSIHQPAIHSGFLDRLLVFAESQSIPPVLIWTKMDLQDKMKPEAIEEWQNLQSCYQQIGYTNFSISSAGDVAQLSDHQEWLNFQQYLAGKRWVIMGSSGVGKSTLIRRLTGLTHIHTAAVNERIGKGKHTTTRAVMYALDGTGQIIDTAGVREFGLSGITTSDIQHFFPEMKWLQGKCHLPNCTHLHEPDCAISTLLQENRLCASRYRSYQNIIASLQAIPAWKKKKAWKK